MQMAPNSPTAETSLQTAATEKGQQLLAHTLKQFYVGGFNRLGVTVDEFQIGGVLETTYGRLQPYITGLLGATLFGPDDNDSEVRFSISIGGGVKFFLFRNLALRADIRGYCSVVESDSAFISHGGVTLVHFSGSTMWQGEVSGGITLAF